MAWLHATKQFQHFITFGVAFREVKCMSQKAFSAGAYHCWMHWHFISLTCTLCAAEMLQISLGFFLEPNPLVTVNMAYERIQIRSYLCITLHRPKLAGYALQTAGREKVAIFKVYF